MTDAATQDCLDRFWKKVRITPGCWEWTAGINKDGYGVFWPTRRPYVLAHRYSYQFQVGTIPAGLFVCHHCDNPICVNPDHLFLGTPADNRADCVSKGRAACRPSFGDRNGARTRPERRCRGEAAPTAKLTTEQVAFIREEFAAGRSTQTELGRSFGVSYNAIYKIVRGMSWAHRAKSPEKAGAE